VAPSTSAAPATTASVQDPVASAVDKAALSAVRMTGSGALTEVAGCVQVGANGVAGRTPVPDLE